MTWFRVDDQAHSDPKLVAAGVRAIGLWTMAGSWSAAQMTDGFVPAHMLPTLGGTQRDADRLVQVGLWTRQSHGGVAGWQFHNWSRRNPTREQVERRREQWRARQDKARGKTPTIPVTHIGEARR